MRVVEETEQRVMGNRMLNNTEETHPLTQQNVKLVQHLAKMEFFFFFLL